MLMDSNAISTNCHMKSTYKTKTFYRKLVAFYDFIRNSPVFPIVFSISEMKINTMSIFITHKFYSNHSSHLKNENYTELQAQTRVLFAYDYNIIHHHDFNFDSPHKH